MPNSIIKWNVEDECKRWYLSLKLKSNDIKYTWRVEPKNNNKKLCYCVSEIINLRSDLMNRKKVQSAKGVPKTLLWLSAWFYFLFLTFLWHFYWCIYQLDCTKNEKIVTDWSLPIWIGCVSRFVFFVFCQWFVFN